MSNVKDMVKQQNETGMKPLEEKKENNRRGSASTTEGGTQAPAQENPAFVPTFTFGGGYSRDHEWFLNRDGELAGVTDEDHNESLGIIRITAFGASDKQRQYGTIANVTVETVLGKISGLQVSENREHRGYLQVGTSSRKVEKDDKVNYYRDYEPNNVMKAQILSWIYPQLTRAQ